MIQMNLFQKQKQIHTHRKQTHGEQFQREYSLVSELVFSEKKHKFVKKERKYRENKAKWTEN